MANFLFDKIQITKPTLNSFDLSNVNRFSCEFGQLVPIACKEVLPGDKFQIRNSALVRLAPMASPAMVRIDVDIHWFFVPNRLIWDHWEEFITGGTDGNSEIISIPMLEIRGSNWTSGGKLISKTDPGSLWDYLNLPPVGASSASPSDPYASVNILPFKAYTKIWNDWYRDEMLDEEIDIHKDDVSNDDVQAHAEDYFNLLYRRYSKDYFTTARPQAQLGSPVLIPGSTDIYSLYSNRATDSSTPTKLSYPFSFSSAQQFDLNNLATLYGGTQSSNNLVTIVPGKLQQDDETKDVIISQKDATVSGNRLRLNLDFIDAKRNIASPTINDLRRAFKLQEWAEKSSFAGNRYIENILAHFGVLSSDARLQRSEYLGGTRSAVVISEIEQNSASTDTTTPLGTLAGRGTSVTTPDEIQFSSEEHGFIIGILSVMPKVGYNQGVPRMYLRKDKFDFAWPEFSNIGEQAVYTSELYSDLQLPDVDLYETFGYQSRYAEYKSSLDEAHGEFRNGESLSSWVQNRVFTEKPVLNSEFIGIENSLATLNNIFAVTEGVNHLYCQVYNDIKALRPLSKYGIPGLL